MTQDPEHESPIVAECAIEAKPEVVYSALTDPKLVQRWWAAWTNCQITRITADARKGGLYHIESRAREGIDHYFRGEFLHLDRHLIAITWVTEYSTGFDSTVYFSISAIERGTRLTVEHRGIQSKAERKRMTGGWPHLLRVMQRGIPRIDESHVSSEVAAFIDQKQQAG